MAANWKMFLLGLVVALPMGAFVIGSLVASAADTPPTRSTLVIQDAQTTPSSPGATTSQAPVSAAPVAPTGRPAPATPTSSTPSSRTTPTSAAPRPTQDTTAASSDDGVEDITPGYDDLPGEDEGDDHGGGRDDDHSGSGSGSSGSSGSGSSGSGSSGSGSSGSGSSGSGSGSGGSGGGSGGHDD